MKTYETPKFQKQRKKLRTDFEKTVLKEAIAAIAANPSGGKKLKGEFKDLRSSRYFADGRERRMIHKSEQNAIYLLSFGPCEGLSELLGRVAYGGEQIVITKRGKPLARLVPATVEAEHLAEAKGWLDSDDDFFKTIDQIIEDRDRHIPRVTRE
ncbi:MAG TPA: type II toxin-antitoxin system prevent-host-death family antitoxin [Syntrophobacteraceae bacterium]|nr:type II toxin-antitoxin system prevent-host-death family antitoxin [Syntrophobacteraceae bacterium]